MTAVRRAWDRLRGLDPTLVDGLLGAALALGSGLEFLREAPAEAVKLPLVLVPPLALVLRRRYPGIGYAIMVVFSTLAARPPTVIGFAALVIGIYSVGAYSRWRLRSLALLLAASIALEVFIPEARPPLPDWSLIPLLVVGLWLAGDALRSLHDRNRRLQREHELTARIAVADERSRIARELHDVVAHSVSLMVVQAGAARRLLGADADRAADALRAVEGGGRDALTELRRMLGLLAGPSDEAAVEGQPGLDQLEALVTRVRGAGLPVELRVEGHRRPLPSGLDLSAYRVVQEALTNVLKHARGARAEVVARFEERELRLEVVDSGGMAAPDAAGAGRGLVGMRERVAACGGELDAGPRPEGGFAVRARLPISEVEAWTSR
ncbi:MAG TPA: histidine kinase [Candidatus Dormibacteraeota bacterium]|nr:histidine kinase [Candidatus Dormibacteraeota bacterium]